MAVTKDTFPFAPLGDAQIGTIMSVCGVRSPDDSPLLDGFRHFIGMNRLVALPEQWYRTYLQSMGQRCLGALGVMADDAVLDCNRGALLYAGAVCEAGGGLQPLPREGEVLADKNEGSALNLATTAILTARDIPSFTRLLEGVRPLFRIDTDYNGLDAASVGAGLLHLITTESVAFSEREGTPLSIPGITPTVASGIRMDDDLIALTELFRDAPWPKTGE